MDFIIEKVKYLEQHEPYGMLAGYVSKKSKKHTCLTDMYRKFKKYIQWKIKNT